MKNLYFLTTLLIVILFVNSCSETEEIKDPVANMGALDEVIKHGNFNGWDISRENGSVILKNSSNPNSVRYYFAPLSGNTQGNRSSGVKVKLAQSGTAGKAGLLYGYDNQTKFYWMLVINSEGALETFKKDQSGLRMVSSQTADNSGNGQYEISIQESGNSVSISVNGRNLGSFQSQNTGKGALGIAAIGTGEFIFSGFYQSDNGIVEQIQPHNNQVHEIRTVNNSANPTAVTQQKNTKTDISGNAVQLTEKTIFDEGRQNFPAYTMLVPKGWEFTGFVKPVNASLYNIPYFSDTVIKAPDGRFVHFYPFFEFGYNDQTRGIPMKNSFDGRYFMRLPNSLGEFWQYLTTMVPDNPISNIRIINEEVVKEATEYVRRASQAQYQGANEFNRQHGHTGTRFVFDIQVRRLEVSYVYEGKPYEEVIFATWGQSTVWYPNRTVKAAMWNLNNMYSVGGPPNSNFLQDPVLAAIVRSRRANKDWTYAIDQFYQNRRKIIIQEGMAAAAAARNSWKNTRSTQSDDVLDISFNGWKKRNSMNNAGHSSSINSIHERTTYATPGGSQVNLPSYYRQVYTDGNGNYLLHNNANYQINSDPRFNQQNWQQINPVR